MAYDPTLTPQENDEASSSGRVYTVGVNVPKTRYGRFKAIINNISLDENSIKAFYYGMKTSMLYIIQGLLGLVTLTIWEPNFTTRAITLKAKHSNMARQHRIGMQEKRAIEEQTLIEAIKSESTPKEPEKSEDEQMEDWLKKYKEA